MPALFGLDEFKNEHDLWLEKRPDIELEPEDVSKKPWLASGDRLEDPLIYWCLGELKGRGTHGPETRVRRNVERVNGLFRVHLDAQLFEFGIGNLDEHIEAKSTGNADGFKKPSEDIQGVPARVVIQAQTQMIASGNERVWVPVLLPGYRSLDWNLYCIERDGEMIEMIQDRGTAWWELYIKRGDKPPDTAPAPHRGILDRIVRQPGVWAYVEIPLIQSWTEARQDRIDCEKREKDRLSELLAAMGTCDGARAKDDTELPEVTFFTRKGKHTLGSKEKHSTDRCGTCGVGTYVGADYRQAGPRKRTQ